MPTWRPVLRAMPRLVLVLFLVSGACGLVYEVVWTRMMSHVFGGTALAIGTVLAAFMTGLAAGGWWIGRLADRVRDPLRLYAGLEAGVAVAAAVAHLLLTQIAPAYLAVYQAFGDSLTALAVARFAIAFGLIAVPTALMGATLPVLARFAIGRGAAVGAGLSTLYAINTLGAVTGAFVAGFFLIQTFGIHGAAAIAVAGNLAVAAIAYVASKRRSDRIGEPVRRDHPSEPPEPQPATVSVATYRLVLAGIGVSGLASFAYEVLWTRCLHFVIGNSTYAVTTTLVAFLSGIALGGYLIRIALRRRLDIVATFGWIQIAIAATASTAMPFLFSVLEPDAIRARAWGGFGDFWTLSFLRFGVALLVMLVPAALIGATFPLAGRIGVRRVQEAGASVGRVYAVNTVGNVLGALLPGLLLIHWLGLRTAILTLALGNLLVGFAALGARVRAVRSLRWALPAALVAAAIFAGVMPFDFRFPLTQPGPRYRVLYERDGPSATTAVLLNLDSREKFMTVDGVTIGGTGVTDYKQQILAHLPKVLLDDVSAELSVGLGSGLLVAESSRHARVERVTCVEIEPTVVEGAGWFDAERKRVAANASVGIVVDDVANHLRTTNASYHVVSADEKTADEFASNGFSYSRDYYRLIAGRLKPGGLVIQWVPTELPPRQYRMVLKTFSETFPHVQLWYFGPAVFSGTSNTILVGAATPISLDLERIAGRLASDSSAFDGLARYGLRTAESIAAQYWTDGATLRAALAGEPVNSLAHPRYEFYAPDDYARPSRARLAENFEFLWRVRRPWHPRRSTRPAGWNDEALLRASHAAESAYLDGCRTLHRRGSPRVAVEQMERAVALAPWNENLRARVFAQYWDLAGQYLSVGNIALAAELDRMALRHYDRHPMGHVEYALVSARAGDVAEGIEAARRAVALDPDLVAARRVLADLLVRSGRRIEAEHHLRALLAIEPTDEEALRRLKGR